MSERYQALFELTRGRIVESIHYGATAVVDSTGRLLYSHGDPQTVTFLRSSAKPFQALPFFERGGPEQFGLTPKEQALICASHEGSDEHVRTVESIQKTNSRRSICLQPDCGSGSVGTIYVWCIYLAFCFHLCFSFIFSYYFTLF